MSETSMDLSPNDIRNYKFSNQMRGYDKEEVKGFLEQVAAVLEDMRQQNLLLTKDVDSLKNQLSGLRQFEESIKNAAIDARRNADATITKAKEEARLILSQAEAKAKEMVGSRVDMVREYEQQIVQLKKTKTEYANKLRDLMQYHLSLIDEIIEPGSTPPAKDSTGKIEVSESSELSRKQLETIADDRPSEPDTVETEEANAPGEIVAAQTTPESTPPPADVEPPVAEGSPVDPELAAALESYKKARAAAPTEPADEKPPAPPPGEIVETTTRAEDIPEGFLVKDDTEVSDDATDKVEVPADQEAATGDTDVDESEPTEHNTIDIDNKATPEQPDLDPGDLAKELDKVAAKFEEEMDKAAKT